MNQNRRYNPNNRRANQELINRNIRAEEVRLISSSGEQLGIISTRDALAQAESEGLDLVIIGNTQVPPVAKIMDHGKHKFQQSKQEKENKKKSKSQGVFKEVKMTPRIGDHDFQVKFLKIVEAIQKEYKVRVLVEMRGREVQHPEIAQALLNRVLEQIQDIAKSDRQPVIKKEGRAFTLQLAPLK